MDLSQKNNSTRIHLVALPLEKQTKLQANRIASGRKIKVLKRLKKNQPSGVKFQVQKYVKKTFPSCVLPGVANEIGNEEEDILSFGELPEGFLQVAGGHSVGTFHLAIWNWTEGIYFI